MFRGRIAAEAALRWPPEGTTELASCRTPAPILLAVPDVTRRQKPLENIRRIYENSSSS
jgi:hypothetical protein